MTDPVIQLWTAQALDARPLSPSELAHRATRFRRRIFIRDLTEYVAGGIAMLAFAGIGLGAPGWPMRLACLVMIAGMALLMRNLWIRRPQDDPAALAQDAYGYLRAQLLAQRDVLASVGRWYIGPLIPGAIAFIAAMFHETLQAASLATAMAASALGGGIMLIIAIGIIWLNRRAARRLTGELQQLDAAHSTAATIPPKE